MYVVYIFVRLLLIILVNIKKKYPPIFFIQFNYFSFNLQLMFDKNNFKKNSSFL